MFELFKRNKQLPPFPALDASEFRDKYFIRTASWRLLDGENIAVTDPHSPRVFTLDAWPQMVFVAADGQRTVKEYVHYMASKYSGKVPELLDATVLDQINTLISYGIIAIVDTKGRPTSEFDHPYELQDGG